MIPWETFPGSEVLPEELPELSVDSVVETVVADEDVVDSVDAEDVVVVSVVEADSVVVVVSFDAVVLVTPPP